MSSMVEGLDPAPENLTEENGFDKETIARLGERYNRITKNGVLIPDPTDTKVEGTDTEAPKNCITNWKYKFGKHVSKGKLRARDTFYCIIDHEKLGGDGVLAEFDGVVDGNRDNDELDFKLFGGPHNNSNVKQGRCYIGGVNFNGDPKFMIEGNHPKTADLSKVIKLFPNTPKNVGNRRGVRTHFAMWCVADYTTDSKTKKETGDTKILVMYDFQNNGNLMPWFWVIDKDLTTNSPYLHNNGKKFGGDALAYLRIDSILSKTQVTKLMACAVKKSELFALYDFGTTPLPQCKEDEEYNPVTQKCEKKGPEPEPEGTYPISGVKMYYNAKKLLSKDAVMPASKIGPDGIFLPSHASGVKSQQVKDKVLLIDGGKGNGRGFFEYDYLPEYETEPLFGWNTVFYSKFSLGKGVENASFKDGNHGTDGWKFDGKLGAGLFGFALHRNEISSDVEYWHSQGGKEINRPYPGKQTLKDDTDYEVFAAFRIDRVKKEVILDVWLDFGDGEGWTHILVSRNWSPSQWNPQLDKAPEDKRNAEDMKDVARGPTFVRRHHLWVRNNDDGAKSDVGIKEFEIGVCDYLA